MTHAPDLALPRSPQLVAPLQGPSDTLAVAGAARPRPFLLTAAGASVRGTETRGIEGVESGGRMLLGRVEIRGATCGNVLLAPAQARRELLGRGGSLIEILLVTSDGFSAQWTPASGSRPGDVELSLLVPGSAWRTDGPFLVAMEGSVVRLLHLTPEAEWSVGEARGALAVSARIGSGEGAIRLLAAVGERAQDAEARVARLARGGEARADGELQAYRSRRLTVRTGVQELDDALAWAAVRLDAALDRDAAQVHDLAADEPFPFDPDARRGWTALGALAAGAPLDAPIALRSEIEAMVLARAATWRGRPLPDAIAQPWIEAAMAGVPAPPAREVARRAALLALADAVEPWQGKERAQAMRARATAAAAPTVRAGTLRLPTLGGGVTGDPIPAVLAAALDLPGRTRFLAPLDDPPPGLLRALTAWACLNELDLERGFALFRAHLADGFAHGAGLWPDGSRIHDPAAAALVPLVFLEGLLGARGDAHYGRLRLAPRLPPHWTKLGVGGIALRDATVRLDYEGEGGSHRFRVAQESGAVPLMLVFEPILVAAADCAVRIDGEPAQVDVLSIAGRTQVKVHLPLDREREISIG
ncbi:MAG: hypothetical protein EXR95_03150 [Gemmatimonadetes bacterium]|nr:hypothetical protein [Gemmatimonadota bacterium]